MRVCEPLAQAPVAAGPRAAITRLMLTNFRSYGMLDLRTDGTHVVLIGPNGAGKTNVLEALSMLSPGRGLRGAKLGEMSRQFPGKESVAQERPWTVSATVQNGASELQIGVGFLPGQAEIGANKRTARVDGIPVSNITLLAEHLRVIWLTPSMDRLFSDGVSERRRFLDRLISSFDPLHARRWAKYETAMRERMGALRGSGNGHWLRAQERTMAEAAVALAASRLLGVRRLGAACDGLQASLFPRAEIAVSGWMETALDCRPAVDVEDEFLSKLEGARSNDLESGRTTEGPHLTDFVVAHREKGRVASQCSTGEQKALLIRLVLGCASVPAAGAPDNPLLLLDEVAAHLDDVRRRALFDEVDALGAQAWMTGTDAVIFGGLKGRAQFKQVSDGQIRPM